MAISNVILHVVEIFRKDFELIEIEILSEKEENFNDKLGVFIKAMDKTTFLEYQLCDDIIFSADLGLKIAFSFMMDLIGKEYYILIESLMRNNKIDKILNDGK